MQDSEKTDDAVEPPVGIVRIAYRQLSIMTGIPDPTEPPASKALPAKSNNGFAAADCLFQLPIVASLASTISGAYASVKGSHETVATVLNFAEDGLDESAKLVAPVTEKIGSALEKPLKSVDAALCHGLELLTANVPSIALPPAQIFESVKNYFRNIISTALEFCDALYGKFSPSIDQGEDSKSRETKKDTKL